MLDSDCRGRGGSSSRSSSTLQSGFSTYSGCGYTDKSAYGCNSSAYDMSAYRGSAFSASANGSAYKDGKHSYDGYSKYSGDDYSNYSNYDGCYKYGGSYGYSESGDGNSEYDDEYDYDIDGADDAGAQYNDESETPLGISQRCLDTGDDVLGVTAPASRLALGIGTRETALPYVHEDVEAMYVGLGIQLQEPSNGSALRGFFVTKLIRSAPGDKCGLILEGDILTAVDGRPIAALRFSEVSALLSGPEGVPITLQFERLGRDGSTRCYDVALRRERFHLDEEAADDGDASEASIVSGGHAVRKADYWEGYRAAMAQKAPHLASGIGDFESDDGVDDDWLPNAPGVPELPRSPLPSNASDDGAEVERTTEQQLAGALAAGATVGLPAVSFLEPLPTMAKVETREKAEAALEVEQISTLSASARKWAGRMSQWDMALKRDLDGLTVKSELLDMWRLKLTRVRKKFSVNKEAVAAQTEQLAAAKLPAPRQADIHARSTSDVLRVVKEGGQEAMAELLTELQRQMVEAERWRTETKRISVQLSKAREEMGRKTREISTMRAQSVTWSSHSKQQRHQLQQAQAEAEALQQTNAAMVSQASALEDRVAKLQDEVTLKSELAAMWRRSAEKGADGGSAKGAGGEAEAAALTWKLEAEKAMRDSERWKALVRRSEEAMRAKDDEALRLRASLSEAQISAERKALVESHRSVDETPFNEAQQALLSAQDDLTTKAEEAAHLAAKVARLESALRHLM